VPPGLLLLHVRNTTWDSAFLSPQKAFACKKCKVTDDVHAELAMCWKQKAWQE